MPARHPLIALLPLALAAAVPVGAAVVAAPAGALPAAATVDTATDELVVDGDCSLREAVQTVGTGLAVDACAVPAAPVVEVPPGLYALDATLVVTATTTIRGTGAVPASIECSAVAGSCIEATGAGADLDLEHLWVSMAAGIQVHAAPGAGHLHLRDVSVWGGSSAVVSQAGDVRLERSTAWDTSGWGVFSLTGAVVVDHSTVGGHADGAVYGDLADITVVASALYDNEGDAVFGQSGDVEVVASTIARNGGDATRTHDGTVTYRSATVVDNRRALNVSGPGEVRFSNTVVADSAFGNCDNPVVSLGWNVSDDDTCGFDQATDRTELDPGLGAFDLLNASPSYSPQADSPLVDTGGDCQATDQLDRVRPTDADGDGVAACEVGAVELPGGPGAPAPTDPPGPTDPSGSSDPTTPTPTSATPATPVAASPRFTG